MPLGRIEALHCLSLRRANRLLVADTQHQNAASRRMLRAGQRQR
jgi:hypothetical protein